MSKAGTSAALKVEGAIDSNGPRLRWKPVRGAKSYLIQWRRKANEWIVVWSLAGDKIQPDSSGFVQYMESSLGGAYRVVAYSDIDGENELAISKPVIVRVPRTAPADLRKRLSDRRTPAAIQSLILGLKWSDQGWKRLLPKEAGICLGKRIRLEVQHPDLTETTIALLETILQNLPKLAARAERAFEGYGGRNALDEEDRLDSPRIVISDQVSLQHSPGTWAMIVEIKGSDYGWHIEFSRTRFKQIWAGG